MVQKEDAAAIKAQPCLKVAIYDLIKNKGFYHGKYIETTGYFNYSFENSAIYPYWKIVDGDSIRFNFMLPGIWVDDFLQTSGNRLSADSFHHKFISVRGFFDTTNKGHMEGYLAAIKHAWDIKEAEPGYNEVFDWSN